MTDAQLIAELVKSLSSLNTATHSLAVQNSSSLQGMIAARETLAKAAAHKPEAVCFGFDHLVPDRVCEIIWSETGGNDVDGSAKIANKVLEYLYETATTRTVTEVQEAAYTAGRQDAQVLCNLHFAGTGTISPNIMGRVEKPSSFQFLVDPWMQTCFGAEIAANLPERGHRFLEEALELVQSINGTREEAHQLVDYVHDRAIGETKQEVGGVMVTLAALCLAADVDMHECGHKELARVWTMVGAIRAKQAAKPEGSPLPQAVEKGAKGPRGSEA